VERFESMFPAHLVAALLPDADEWTPVHGHSLKIMKLLYLL
jgi:hypothetical protein